MAPTGHLTPTNRFYPHPQLCLTVRTFPISFTYAMHFGSGGLFPASVSAGGAAPMAGWITTEWLFRSCWRPLTLLT